jgi:hypothetical protein
MSRRPEGWVGWKTTGCVALLALIAGTVSYLHMHQLVAGHGQPGWVAALTPLSSVSGQRRAAPGATGSRAGGGRELQLQAWQWAWANQTSDGSLPSGKAIAGRYGRRERWGRLVKQAGLEGAFATDDQAA